MIAKGWMRRVDGEDAVILIRMDKVPLSAMEDEEDVALAERLIEQAPGPMPKRKKRVLHRKADQLTDRWGLWVSGPRFGEILGRPERFTDETFRQWLGRALCRVRTRRVRPMERPIRCTLPRTFGSS